MVCCICLCQASVAPRAAAATRRGTRGTASDTQTSASRPRGGVAPVPEPAARSAMEVTEVMEINEVAEAATEQSETAQQSAPETAASEDPESLHKPEEKPVQKPKTPKSGAKSGPQKSEPEGPEPAVKSPQSPPRVSFAPEQHQFQVSVGAARAAVQRKKG